MNSGINIIEIDIAMKTGCTKHTHTRARKMFPFFSLGPNVLVKLPKCNSKKRSCGGISHGSSDSGGDVVQPSGQFDDAGLDDNGRCRYRDQ